MTNIWQVTWQWTGFSGAPGYTNLYYESTAGDAAEALAAATKSRLLWSGTQSLYPSSLVLQLVTDVRLLDDATGDLQDIVTVSGITSITGSGVANYAGPAGACIDWPTTTVHGTRRLQGRTFLVPTTNEAYDNSGTITSAKVLQIATAAEAMRTASGPAFGVWGRPRVANPTHVPPITARAGLWGPAVSSRVPDKTVILRSRRD